MKRRSRAGGETSKRPGRKTPQPERRNAPKAPAARSNSAIEKMDVDNSTTLALAKKLSLVS
jgi:hypothetical protein